MNTSTTNTATVMERPSHARPPHTRRAQATQISNISPPPVPFPPVTVPNPLSKMPFPQSQPEALQNQAFSTIANFNALRHEISEHARRGWQHDESLPRKTACSLRMMSPFREFCHSFRKTMSLFRGKPHSVPQKTTQNAPPRPTPFIVSRQHPRSIPPCKSGNSPIVTFPTLLTLSLKNVHYPIPRRRAG